jgi:hypothetical protein
MGAKWRKTTRFFLYRQRFEVGEGGRNLPLAHVRPLEGDLCAGRFDRVALAPADEPEREGAVLGEVPMIDSIVRAQLVQIREVGSAQIRGR